jgi:glycosyltransferase involved in cell wall biosynthesis
MTPLYVRKPKLIFIHEIAGSIWDKMFPFPINRFGYWLESFLFRFYRNETFVCVSESTKADLVGIGIPKDNISVIHNGVSLATTKTVKPKEKVLTVMFLNRVVRMKGIFRALEVFSEISKLAPLAQFWVVGKVDPNFKQSLLKVCASLGIKNKVKFYGFVSETKKTKLLSKAHVLVNTSYKEGWGLVNIEANSQGTPVVGFAVKGNVDSIKNGINGYLIEDGNIKAMANKVTAISDDSDLRIQCIKYASLFSWDTSAKKFYKRIEKEINA